MRALIIVVLVVAAAWSGYWVVGARMVEGAIAEWFAERRAEGWLAEAAGIDVAGFPNRFDATLSEVALADPETGLAWEAPFLALMALSYRPNEVIAVWPERQVVATPEQRIAVTSQSFRASLFVEAGNDQALRRATVVIEDMALDSNAGWEAALQTGRIASRRIEDSPTDHRIGVEAQRLRLDAGLARALDPSGQLPDVIERLRLDASVAFDAPWDLTALEVARPQPERIELHDLSARWGEADLRVTGSLEMDDAGLADGRLTIRTTNWREILALAVETGVVPERLSGTVERALEGLAGLSGSGEALDVPLGVDGGRISLGPVPVGQMPPLVLR